MNAKQLTKMMSSETGMSAKAMSLKMGHSQNYISKSIAAPGITFATMQSIADAFGYELTVKKKTAGRKSNAEKEACK